LAPLTFYFDRNIGRRIPESLMHLKTPFDVQWHNKLGFRHDMPDDEWMAIVGARGWIVFSQDYKFHKYEFEYEAVKQHNLRCFYLPETGAKTWTTMCAFTKASDRIIQKCETVRAPFIYKLSPNGRLSSVPL
jgi:hypothetical protein